MASSIVSNKCSDSDECKRNAIVKCDGCLARFCSNHFPIHRQKLENQLELICSDRDQLYHQIQQQQIKDPIDLFKQIDQWEQQTLIDVKKTANNARDRIRQLLTKNNSNSQFEQFSQELKRRKESEDYFENDLQRLEQQLENLNIELRQSLKLNIEYIPIDWQTILQIHFKKQQQIPQRFFRDTLLLNLEHQKILNDFCKTFNQQWQLIYRGTRDGFGENTFLSQCADQGPTITIISVDKYLFGGYTNINWKHSIDELWDTDPTAFLFTLINPYDIPPTKYTIKSTGDHAIRSCTKFGPTFGYFDICIHSNSNTNQYSNSGFPKNYCDTTQMGSKTFTGNTNFQITDIEVYRQISLIS